MHHEFLDTSANNLKLFLASESADFQKEYRLRKEMYPLINVKVSDSAFRTPSSQISFCVCFATRQAEIKERNQKRKCLFVYVCALLSKSEME